MSDVKLQRTLARFSAKLDSGEYYEAHQTLRTIANRYIKSKQYTEAIDLLYQGAQKLAVKGEYASSSDLISYLIHTLEEGGVVCSGSHTTKLKLIELINLLPSAESSLTDLAKQAINWSIKGSDSKFGDHDLHHTFGVKLLQRIQEVDARSAAAAGAEADGAGAAAAAAKTASSAAAATSEEDRYKLFSNAELHLILGTHDSLPYYVDFLYEWYRQGAARAAAASSSSLDPGIFLARAVINYSYLRNQKFAHESLAIFLKRLLAEPAVQSGDAYEAVSGGEHVTFYSFKQYEVLNFLQLLVITLGKADAGPKFLKLYSQYQPLLRATEILAPVEYLGKLYFNLQLGNPNGNQNMLANLMGGLFK